jgi:nitroreductase
VTEPNPSLAPDTVGLLEGLATTRAIRRYTDDPVPNDVLRDIMFAATRAPSGSNRQPFRFLVFTDSDRSRHVKQIVARGGAGHLGRQAHERRLRTGEWHGC